MLNEISQSKKYCVIPTGRCLKGSNSEKQSRMWLLGAGERGTWGVLGQGEECQLRKVRKF